MARERSVGRPCRRCSQVAYCKSDHCKACLELIDAIILRAIEGGDAELWEVAQELGLTYACVEQRYYRAMRKQRAQAGPEETERQAG